MSSALDMSLDDIIKKSKMSEGYYGNSTRRDSGHDPNHRFMKRNATKRTPYSTPRLVPESMLQANMVLGGEYLEEGTKLYISNLYYGVSNQDIRILFSETGQLKRYAIHYDRSGRSKGTAEVVFGRHSDALEAMKRYNDALLDGKPLQIELVGAAFGTPGFVSQNSNCILAKPNGGSKDGRGRFLGCGLARGSVQGNVHRKKPSLTSEDHDTDSEVCSCRIARGFVQVNDHHQKPNVTAEELDADLEKYRQSPGN